MSGWLTILEQYQPLRFHLLATLALTAFIVIKHSEHCQCLHLGWHVSTLCKLMCCPPVQQAAHFHACQCTWVAQLPLHRYADCLQPIGAARAWQRLQPWMSRCRNKRPQSCRQPRKLSKGILNYWSLCKLPGRQGTKIGVVSCPSACHPSIRHNRHAYLMCRPHANPNMSQMPLAHRLSFAP